MITNESHQKGFLLSSKSRKRIPTTRKRTKTMMRIYLPTKAPPARIEAVFLLASKMRMTITMKTDSTRAMTRMRTISSTRSIAIMKLRMLTRQRTKTCLPIKTLPARKQAHPSRASRSSDRGGSSLVCDRDQGDEAIRNSAMKMRACVACEVRYACP